MAFSTSNVQKSYFGDLKVTYGDWTANAGDTSGSIGVSGGRVYLTEFTSQDSTQKVAQVVTSTSGTAGTVTVTVYNLGGVTAGRFLIIHK